MLISNKIHIYTDSSKSNYCNKVGISFIVVDYKHNQIILEYGEQLSNITNNQGELIAIGKAIEFCLSIQNYLKKVVIYSDSLYSVRALNGKFRPQKNVKLIKSILAMRNLLRIRNSILWIKGHSKHIFNDRADELANIMRCR